MRMSSFVELNQSRCEAIRIPLGHPPVVSFLTCTVKLPYEQRRCCPDRFSGCPAATSFCRRCTLVAVSLRCVVALENVPRLFLICSGDQGALAVSDCCFGVGSGLCIDCRECHFAMFDNGEIGPKVLQTEHGSAFLFARASLRVLPNLGDQSRCLRDHSP